MTDPAPSGVGGQAEYVLADGVAAAVAAGLGDVTAAGGGGDESPEFDGTALEVVFPSAERLADLGEDRLPDGVIGQLLDAAADGGGGRCEQGVVLPSVEPGAPCRRAVGAVGCPTGENVVQPSSVDPRDVEHREPGAIVLEASTAGAAPDCGGWPSRTAERAGRGAGPRVFRGSS